MKRDFEGIHHCTMGPYEIIRIDPKNPSVRFETVMPLGYNRDGHYGECRDVYVPDNHPYGKSPGPGCYVDDHYPGEQISSMANRYPGSVVAFNGDFFSPAYAFGPIGLTVKNGSRLDGYYDDGKLKEVQRSSISIAKDGEVRIGIVPRNKLPNPEEPWGWQPEPLAYYNTIGGLPQLVEGGYPVDLNSQCILEEGWCPDQNIPRARTAVGKTIEGHLFVVVAPEASGLTLLELSHLMVELGAIEAINLDGGGSSQLWYAGEYLVFSPRPIAEGMLVFSESVQITNIGEMGSYKSQIPE
ncbi:MAG: hypothetical protein GTO18_02650 [Anaerolineales bacterium]|nr:hypothetical protein [Anaerolineales bacterium]